MLLDTAAWTAIAFLFVGLLLLLAEAVIPGFFIAVPGGTLVLMGGIGLLFPGAMFGMAGWFLWPFAALVSTSANIYLYKRWAPAGHAPLTMTADSLPGQVGTVTTAVVPGAYTGKVRIRGATWSARADVPIPSGAPVRVVRADGIRLVVEPAQP
ncbi:MAG TPA: NfeD family protein [Candidatus Thermoplasmatota archaeon]|nr:NfeD family protein [Candidatus Thermoplasmatota archaeon]